MVNDSDYIGGVPFYQKGAFTDSVDAAISTLKGMGYTFNGGALWKPPLGKMPESFEDKPVFTQEMAEGGELPMMGARFRVGHEYTCVGCTTGGSVIGEGDDGQLYCFHAHQCLPILTERDRAITEMLELDLWATDREFAEAVYDAGYRK